MAEELLVYPDERIREISRDIDRFDEELIALIDTMRSTMEVNDAEGLAAIQLGYKAKVILVKDEKGEILELINARITEAEEPQMIEEQTLYYPGVTVNINRFNKIKVSYQDREGTFRSIRPPARLGWLIQRKVDYTFSATSIQKVSKEERKRLEKLLKQSNGPAEPVYEKTINYRDRLYRAIDYLLILGFISLLTPLLISSETAMTYFFQFEQLLSGLLFVMIIGYFFFAQYEAKHQKVCTSCQTTNIAALTAFALGKWMMFFGIGYLLIDYLKGQ